MNFATIRAIVILSLGGVGAVAAFFNLDFLDQVWDTNSWTVTMRTQENVKTWEGPRAPVPGTVPANSREMGPQLLNGDGFASVTVGANAGNQIALINAHRDVEMPSDLNEGALYSGAELYEMHCAACHGTGGLGDGGVVQAAPAMTPPSLSGASAVGMTDGEIYAIIRVGRVRMPAYGGRITPDDRWRIVQHVRSLQQGS